MIKKTIFILPLFFLLGVSYWYYRELKEVKNASFIIINKADMTLSQFNYKGKLLHKFSIATGKNFGNKTKVGDCKTPESIFPIVEVVDASTWTHDFKDDLGIISGAYGPYFIRLLVPGQKGIGIHGTHDNGSLGKRASEGCIRLKNSDLSALIENISTNGVVVITPGIEDVKITSNPDLPNNTDKEMKKVKSGTVKNSTVIFGNKLVLKK